MADIKEGAHEVDEMETVVEAGRILMESGAEIYRINDTMAHMADALQIEHFSAYVINRGIFVSGTNREGIQESKIIGTPDSSIHLRVLGLSILCLLELLRGFCAPSLYNGV